MRTHLRHSTLQGRGYRLGQFGSALAVSLLLSAAATAASFEAPDPDFGGRLQVTNQPVVPGTDAALAGQAFKPGQEITISYAGEVLSKAVANGEGQFTTTLKIPAQAVPGQHPLVVQATKPTAATVFPLKISPNIPLSGQERFDIARNKLAPGLYQAAYSAKSDRIYVTAAAGRQGASVLLSINPQTLQIDRQAPAGGLEGRTFGVYGLGVDDTNGTIWTTNTRDNTVAVYRQSDLSLVKQFEPGAAQHSRDVIVDEKLGRAYVSENGTPNIAVFDTASLTRRGQIEIRSEVRGPRGGSFSPMSLELDAEAHKLFTVSLTTNEIAIINTATDQVEKVFAVPGALSASGIAYDRKTNRLFVASQGSDNLVIVDAASGQVVKNVLTGAGALNVAFDPVTNLAYVPNRGSGTVTVVTPDGEIVANLDGGTFPNHVHEDGKGNVFAINKARGQEDPRGDQITRLVPRR